MRACPMLLFLVMHKPSYFFTF